MMRNGAASANEVGDVREILSSDAQAFFRELGREQHLTPQRSNGVRAMIERIRADAAAA